MTAIMSPEQNASEQSGHAAQRLGALGEMTGAIVHDFRNILAIIDSSLRLTEAYSEDPAKVRAFVASAQDGVRRGTQLTAELLTFAKEHDLPARVGNLNDCLTKLERFLRFGAGPEVRLLLDLANDAPQCRVDRTQFNAAMLNLVVNARDAMPKGGTIRISTERWVATSVALDAPIPGTYVRLQVTDDGHGMHPDVTSRIFDPFFTTKGEKGTGLGLPQVSAFMRLIGGHVSVASELGMGTTVSLYFPAVEAGYDDSGSS
jgi:signal transduction histidine kinase